MAIYNIVQIGDDVLREKAKAVPKITRNIHKLLDNMAKTMYSARGVGLAAPQVGISKRIIVVDAGEGLMELINPEIIFAAGEQVNTEACLSIPGVSGEVTRAYEVHVKYLDRYGKENIIKAKGFPAIVFQHEIDHLDGILFIDRARSISKV
ncbi:MAG TPA: peptide deformylase [Bacillota bacterium]|jgi:peptide deformylase|nr:peptide deformylase [Peptococcaceae bacterium MAG4]NLW37474.1 peptide deformylase [Peptococcaceae bacterium]HPU36055.1 peptide deformylase [Bacillota bacterium]HPZ43759.1 peptide deformylase [Bacillota bacterium]HQD76180.1 peptide deformylase [Bacillota bacterium]